MLHPDSGKFLLADNGKFGVAEDCCCGDDCIDCIDCGDCRFHPDSTLTAQFLYIGQTHTDWTCTSPNPTSGGAWYRESVYTRSSPPTGYELWENTAVELWYNSGEGWYDGELSLHVKLRKQCVPGSRWEIEIIGVSSWKDLGPRCWEGGIYGTFGDLGTACSGGSDNGAYCCPAPAAPFPLSAARETDSYIIVNNNPLP